MTNKTDAHTYAARILKPMARYIDVAQDGRPPWLTVDALPEGEELIGVYQNEIGVEDDAILVTSIGIRWRSGNFRSSISYSEVDRIRTALTSEEKSCVEGVHVTTRLEELFVPVRGRNGNFADAFEFSRFLQRASSR